MGEGTFYNSITECKISEIDDFITLYANNYYLGCENPELVPGLSRSNRHVEEEIENLLERGIQKEQDVVHILAWKVGKIKHSESKAGKIAYAKDWVNAEKLDADWKNAKNFGVTLYGKPFDIKKIAEYIVDKNKELETRAISDPQSILRELNGLEMKGLGPVYLITLLYFLSKGTYPIYDRFAHIAIKMIYDGRDFTSLVTDKELRNEFNPDINNFNDYIEKYMDRIDEIFKLCNCEKKRDIDRALWVYGHLFNDNKTNRKRVEKKTN